MTDIGGKGKKTKVEKLCSSSFFQYKNRTLKVESITSPLHVRTVKVKEGNKNDVTYETLRVNDNTVIEEKN